MNFKPVQCILTALKYESEPIIDHYGLARDKTFDFPVYRSGSMVLLGIGVGKKFIKTRICELYAQKQDYEEYQYVNIGIAGGNPANTALGGCYMVNKIYDEHDKIYYYPDLPAGHPFQDLNTVEFKKNIISKLISNNMNTIDSFLKSCYFEEY